MFQTHQKSTGTGYTGTVALLTAALIFSPAYVFAARPVGMLTVSLAIAFSVICIALAWVTWKRASRVTMSSLVNQEAASK